LTDTLWLSLFLMACSVAVAVAWGTMWGVWARFEDEMIADIEAERAAIKANIAKLTRQEASSRTWSA